MEPNEHVHVARVHQIAQRATDPDRASAWYCDVLGARFLARFDPPGMAFVELGGTRLLLEPGAPSARLYVEVDDLERTHATLRASGVVFEGEPHLIHHDDEGWFGPPGGNEWMAFLRDPDGNLLALVERRSPPG